MGFKREVQIIREETETICNDGGGEKRFDGGFHASLLPEAQIAVAVGAKIHGGGEETPVVRTETVAFGV